MISGLSAALDKVDRSDHPGVSDEAFDTICQRVTLGEVLPAGAILARSGVHEAVASTPATERLAMGSPRSSPGRADREQATPRPTPPASLGYPSRQTAGDPGRDALGLSGRAR